MSADSDADDIVPFIVEAVSQPVRLDREDRTGKGVDLTPFRTALPQLMDSIAETYAVAMDDWLARADPAKPKRRLDENWTGSASHDYGELAGEGLNDWEEHWQRFFARGRGNPGTNRHPRLHRSNPPPLAPLRPVYAEVRRWWRVTIERPPFSPRFGRAVEGEQYDFDYCNAPARLLILTAQWLGTYSIANVAGLHDAMKRNKPPSA